MRDKMQSPRSTSEAMRIGLRHVRVGETESEERKSQTLTVYWTLNRLLCLPMRLAGCERGLRAVLEERVRKRSVGTPTTTYIRRAPLPPPPLISLGATQTGIIGEHANDSDDPLGIHFHIPILTTPHPSPRPTTSIHEPATHSAAIPSTPLHSIASAN
jgi:hypothetical protein